MKLKNKKTKEIGYFCFANWNDPVLIIMDKNGVQLAKYNSLAELNEEWEDAPEEPKEYWCLGGSGEVRRTEDNGVRFDKDHKEIGNYFESKEEAELAVRKLKAWKRLKDKGFKFYDWKDEPTYRVTFEWEENIKVQEIQDDLDLLFSGGEG